MLTTFADMVLGFGVGHAVGNGAFMPTIGLTAEFLAPAPQGSWVSGQAEILRLGRRLGVARCRITCDQTGLVMHASGTFKLDRPVAGDFSHSDYLSRD
jgi:acyl-coenzyme A thioesterase PaaI-like protein